MSKKSPEGDTQLRADTQTGKDKAKVIPTELVPLAKEISKLPPEIRERLKLVLDTTVEKANRRHRANALTKRMLRQQIQQLEAALKQLAATNKQSEEETD